MHTSLSTLPGLASCDELMSQSRNILTVLHVKLPASLCIIFSFFASFSCNSVSVSFLLLLRYDRHPMYKDLKEKARAFITDITTPFDDYDGVDARLVDPRPPLRSFRGLRKRQVTTDSSQQTATDVTHSSMQLTDHRLSSSSNGIAERQTETRPPLESTGGLEARQEIPTFVSGSSNSLGAPQESTRPATLELRSRREAMAAELPSSRPTFLSVLAGIHWRKAASRGETERPSSF